MTPTDRPKLAKKARIRVDRVEGKTVLLSPERGLALNPSGARILALCDGVRSVAEIARAIASETNADARAIEADAVAFLGEIEARGLVECGRHA